MNLSSGNHPFFCGVWRSCSLLLAAAFVALVYSAAWEYSVRRYLDGFSDAIVPAGATPEQQVESILNWMRSGPPRAVAPSPESLAKRDPENTLNYQQLLRVCGTATNAFLNLAKSSDLQARRLLLLDPSRRARHVVTEVLMNGRWIIVDPAYRAIMRDAQGRLLTRQDMRDPSLFAQAIAAIPGYPSQYTYESVAHVRTAKIPMDGLHLRSLLESVYPNWDEALGWSLLLERESFFALVVSLCVTIFLLLCRFGLGWYADRRLNFPRFRFRQGFLRAGAAFFSTPEMKQ